MQKLITIGLKSYNYEHGYIEEHLAEYLNGGWKIDSYQITSVELEDGSASHNANIWIAVVLSQTGTSNDRKKKKGTKRKA